MNQVLEILMGVSTREMLFAIPGQFVILSVADRILERERSRIFIITVFLTKLAFFYYWEQYFNKNPSLMVTIPPYYTVYCLWRDTLTAIVFIFTYSKNLVKAMIAIPLTEMVASLVSIPPLILINILEGRQDITVLPSYLMPLDIFLPVLILLLWTLLKKPLGVVMKAYRNWKPVHKKGLVCLSLLYVALSFMEPLRSTLLATSGVRMFYILHLVAAVIVISGLLLWVRKQDLEMDRQNRYLEEQLKLMQDHYSLIRQNREIVEEKRKQLNSLDAVLKEKLKQVDLLEDDALSGKTEKMPLPDNHPVEEYVSQLKEDYQGLQAGFYCSDTEIDAVLCVEKAVMEQRGIQTEIRISLLDGDKIKSDSLVHILVLLFEEAMNQSVDKFQLEMKTVKNQLLITASPSGKWRRERYRMLKKQIKQAGGTLIEQNEALSIMIPVA